MGAAYTETPRDAAEDAKAAPQRLDLDPDEASVTAAVAPRRFNGRYFSATMPASDCT
ncbi:MAG: hypothetical protein AAF928_02560 [Myxococcota bacterium]